MRQWHALGTTGGAGGIELHGNLIDTYIHGIELPRIDKGRIIVIKIRVGQIIYGPGLPARIGKHVLDFGVLENGPDCIVGKFYVDGHWNASRAERTKKDFNELNAIFGKDGDAIADA